MEPDVSERAHRAFLDAVYDAAINPDSWTVVLAQLASLFESGFADIFTRTHDREHCSGLAYGLDRADYEDGFLGTWFRRNVWRQARPVAAAGEVLSTRSIVDVGALRSSAIYNEYLAPRGLHEGLRLSLWVGRHEVQYISVLRPWSAGAFGAAAVARGRMLLPHLQRAAAITRRLRESDVRLRIGPSGADDTAFAVILFDRSGQPFWFNAGAEAILAEGTLLRLSGGALAAVSPAATEELRRAVARAAGAAAGGMPEGTAVVLRRVGGIGTHKLVVLPVPDENGWATARPPAAVAFMRNPVVASPTADELKASFALTRAEAELAQALLAGRSLREIASRTGRSVNTIRTHLARLMDKTETSKQADLVRLLGDVAPLGSTTRLAFVPRAPAALPLPPG